MVTDSVTIILLWLSPSKSALSAQRSSNSSRISPVLPITARSARLPRQRMPQPSAPVPPTTSKVTSKRTRPDARQCVTFYTVKTADIGNPTQLTWGGRPRLPPSRTPPRRHPYLMMSAANLLCISNSAPPTDCRTHHSLHSFARIPRALFLANIHDLANVISIVRRDMRNGRRLFL